MRDINATGKRPDDRSISAGPPIRDFQESCLNSVHLACGDPARPGTGPGCHAPHASSALITMCIGGGQGIAAIFERI
jgi:hypothetical protein